MVETTAVLTEVGKFLSERANDLRDAMAESAEQLKAEPGNGVVIENRRILGTLQNLQAELARQIAGGADVSKDMRTATAGK